MTNDSAGSVTPPARRSSRSPTPSNSNTKRPSDGRPNARRPSIRRQASERDGNPRIAEAIWPYRGAICWFLVAAVLHLAMTIDRSARGDPRILGSWAQFDGHEYLKIAAEGYQARSLVWFPLYPMLIRAISTLGVDPTVAGVGLTSLAGVLGFVLYGRWLDAVGVGKRAQVGAFVVLALYPYGWYLYGAVHADSLFLALVIGAFLAVERDRPGLAALLGALATATRPTGMVVVIPLLLRSMEHAQVLNVPAADDSRWPDWVAKARLPLTVDRSRWTPAVLAPAAAVGGLAVYMGYGALVWGNPFGFAAEQERYHGSGWRNLIKQQYFDAWSLGFDGRHLATTTAQAILVVIVLVSVGAVGVRFGWGYGTLVAGLGLLPGLTVSTFMGSGRYLIPAFPLWALIGERVSERRWGLVAYAVVSAGLLVWLTVGFGRSWYLT